MGCADEQTGRQGLQQSSFSFFLLFFFFFFFFDQWMRCLIDRLPYYRSVTGKKSNFLPHQKKSRTETFCVFILVLQREMDRAIMHGQRRQCNSSCCCCYHALLFFFFLSMPDKCLQPGLRCSFFGLGAYLQRYLAVVPE